MVLLFALAVLGVILAVDLVIAGVYIEMASPAGPQANWFRQVAAVPRELYLWGAVATAAVILMVSLWNVAKLAGGGDAVAAMAGARRVSPDTQDPLERRLRNVVEEMAIAAGVRVPGVYVMDGERGINAFAAGWDVSNSVVAVTRGTLETLTRDELQGVVGHEFSHILNGDMRLNVRMLGVLAGIVFIGSIGEFILRNARGSRGGKGSSGGIVIAGLALLVIGYVGLFFARLIKASVSRQREFLADAASVQFTRNPDGIAGALDRIRASSALIDGRYAEDLSHMFFGQSVKVWLGGLFDTHPPLDERIRRVHPRFQPSSYRARREAAAPASPAGGEAAFGRSAGFAGGRRASDSSAAWGRSAAESASLVGTLDRAKVDYAARLLASLPGGLRESLREADGARAALVALLLAPKDEVAALQLAVLEAANLGPLAQKARAAAPLTRRLGPAFHLPVVDLALPAVKAAPEAAKRDLLTALEGVIRADRRVTLHEFVVLTLVRDQLAPKMKPSAGGRKLADLAREAATLLAIVAHAGVRADATGERKRALDAALAAGAKEMQLSAAVPEAAALTPESAGRALEALKGLAPMQKAILVKGLFAAVSADGTIRVAEAELMRLAGAVLDCPLPPLLESLDPATLAA
jgi:Zn-dependent protease with chaperone function